MKLRAAKNSLRIRLSDSEAIRWNETGTIEEVIEFAPSSRFVYRLERDASVPGIAASFHEGILRIMVSEPIAIEWLASGTEGIYSSRENGALEISIERDLDCKHPAA